MKQIFVYRHADTHPAQRGQTDFERTLTEEGLTECQKMVSWLVKQVGEAGLPDHILCSTANRALQTLKTSQKTLNSEIAITEEQKLYLATTGEIFKVVNDLGGDAERLMIIGHNPGLHQFCLMLAHKSKGSMGDLAFHFPTASMAHFQLDINNWATLSPETPAELLHFMNPKILD